MLNYRKLWKSHNGSIPIDSEGRPYEIHHIDGDRSNNDISNLVCVSIKEHYAIHSEQGDYMACLIMSKRMGMSYEETLALSKLALKKRDQTGDKNPMWGKSTSEIVQKVWESRDDEYRKEFGKKVSDSKKGTKTGKSNHMYGRSAVREQNLRWYNNGVTAIYVSEGTQPEGFNKGRGKCYKRK